MFKWNRTINEFFNGLKLCVSIEKKIKKYFIVMRENFRREISREKVHQTNPFYTTELQ